MSSSRKFTKLTGSWTDGVIVKVSPGMVTEYGYDSAHAPGPGDRQRCADPERLARDIAADLEADGYTEVPPP